MPSKRPNKKNLVQNYSEWYQFVGILPDPYTHLHDYNIYELFRNMRKYDSHIKAAYQQRLINATKTKWEIQPASDSAEDKKRAEFIQENLDELVTNGLFTAILSAVPDGFSVNQLVYDRNKDGYWYVKKAKQLFPEIFGFNENGDLLLRKPGHAPTLDYNGQDLYPNVSKYKPNTFMVHTNNGEFSDRAGVAILAACYWPWIMKKAGLEFWSKMLERFGSPSVAAFFEDSGSEEQKKARREAIAESLLDFIEGSAGAFSDVKDIQVVDTKGRGTDFLDFENFLNSEISKAFLTETLTLETQGVGSYALGEIHLDILKQVVVQDVKAMQYTLNSTLIPWLYQYNWGDAEPCKIVFDLKQIMDIKNVLELIKAGVPISLEKLESDYYAPIAKDGDTVAVVDNTVQLSKKKDQFNPYL